MENLDELQILLVGNGGREHALAWKLSQSPRVKSIWVAPGNGGTGKGLAKVQNVTIGVEDFAGLMKFAKENEVNLIVPGPEVPLVAGIETACRTAGIRCFGPSIGAAQMEGSKAHAKAFMTKYNIPTASYQSFREYDAAKVYLDSVDYKVVLKADGLAAGKGVIIPQSNEEAHDALKTIMLEREFGAAGDEVIIEEYLEGAELSILSFCDGYTIRSLPAAQDHKQINDGDKGPMTGGMGCYSPTTIATPALVEEIHRTILQRTIDGMRLEKTPMVGMLFTGLMITSVGPRVLEYNVRFGDPETETLLPLLSSSTDLASVMLACTDRYLDAITLSIDEKFSCTVIAVAGGYPGTYAKGTPIILSAPPTNTTVFHAGTSLSDDQLLTSGGRVLAITSAAPTLKEAISTAYSGVSSVSFSGMYYRRDIGHRALSPTPSAHAPSLSKSRLDYASAGVSITSGNALVAAIKPLVRSTLRPGSSASIGGFGSPFSLPGAGYPASAPTLISAIDGVGTKLFLAHALDKHDTVGIDCVAMNANDLVVQGAEVLLFLDIYTTGKLDARVAGEFVKGVAEGCRRAGCVLAGGETAEMPGLLAEGVLYDAGGAAVGALEEGQTLLPDLGSMRAGDVLLGLKSDGCHSNGFSLIRKILERAGLGLRDPAPWIEGGGRGVGEELLTPTRIYVKPCLRLAREGLVKGFSHVTGGGLVDNAPRMLPQALTAEFDARRWKVPEVMRWLKKEGGVEDAEFATVWNTGIGMVLVVGEEEAARCVLELEEMGETVWEIGKLVERAEGGEGCVIRNMEVWN
ncbi:MAG: hypothetical protein MMC23_006045 [Stictis urceolatum]|nr:hypothetical protein [Stictis urceolata]